MGVVGGRRRERALLYKATNMYNIIVLILLWWEFLHGAFFVDKEVATKTRITKKISITTALASSSS